MQKFVAEITRLTSGGASVNDNGKAKARVLSNISKASTVSQTHNPRQPVAALPKAARTAGRDYPVKKASGREVRPEEVIPFDDDKFDGF
jgi:hypothetical protein